MSATTGFQAEETASEGRLLDARNGKDVVDLPSEHVIDAMAFSADSRLLATNEYQKGRGDRPNGICILRLRDAQSGRELAACSHDKSWIMRLGFSPDGKSLAAWGYSSEVCIWDVEEIRTKGAAKTP